MGEALIEGRGLGKTYRQGSADVPVLRGIDISLAAGEVVALIGPSGSGKSTLLHILGLMDRPDAGQVLVDGRPVEKLPESERSRLRNQLFGFVFQFDSLLPEFTVLENATMPGRIAQGQGSPVTLREFEARAVDLLNRFGLKGLESRFPQELSGGERQRAALARALINRPRLLLADEPTGNLDRKNGELVFNILKKAAAEFNIGVLVVTHNDYAALFASRVLHLTDGHLAVTLREAAGEI